MRILIVDRDMGLARQLSSLLKMEGHEILTAPETVDLPCLASDVGAHLVIYEPLLLGFDRGLDQCRRLRIQSECLLLIISDAAELEDKLKAFAAGADDYLVKPFDVRELHAHVLALLRRHLCTFINSPPHVVMYRSTYRA